MNGVIFCLMVFIVFVMVLGLTLVAADHHRKKVDEREAAQLKVWEDAKAEETKQAQRIARAKRLLDAQATAAQELIKKAVPQPTSKPRK